MFSENSVAKIFVITRKYSNRIPATRFCGYGGWRGLVPNGVLVPGCIALQAPP